jgi:Fic family protein
MQALNASMHFSFLSLSVEQRFSSQNNQSILINTLCLQEAKDSSAIENIITTHDDLYKSGLDLKTIKSLNAKEVQNYISALKSGFELLSKR